MKNDAGMLLSMVPRNWHAIGKVARLLSSAIRKPAKAATVAMSYEPLCAKAWQMASKTTLRRVRSGTTGPSAVDKLASLMCFRLNSMEDMRLSIWSDRPCDTTSYTL